MLCLHCNYKNPADAKFCAECGSTVGVPDQQSSTEHKLRTAFSDIANKINQAAGVETPVELNLREVFSKVFARHSEEEAERLFFVGTSHTTPDIDQIVDSWPKPWLFARIFALVAFAYFGLYMGLDWYENINFLPGLIMLGSFMVPFTILIFFWEMNAPQNISIYKIIKMLFVGGVLSLVTAVFLYDKIGNSGNVLFIGIVEEVAKLIAVLWFLRGNKYKYVLNGLLVGAAVGTGFAAFESAGYAFQMLMMGDLELMYSTIFWRGVLAPGGHIVWAALSGAALCMAKRERKFTLLSLGDIRFLRIFGIVILLHILWDLPLPFISELPIVQLLLTVISWVIAFAVINSGLKEISQLKHQPLAIADTVHDTNQGYTSLDS
ncbi:PrsW family glutamic-type intramembrane protease [Brevibacillus migulae]|uniref:PrsW family glutamic-type intramembrane protease n=1 Tax=Brevibacillus migulae TaxID=1644114 RepID=UPI00106EBE4E|nr:PrsW family glutamic-type intramembrane protease [Brevibacillus migulae]